MKRSVLVGMVVLVAMAVAFAGCKKKEETKQEQAKQEEAAPAAQGESKTIQVPAEVEKGTPAPAEAKQEEAPKVEEKPAEVPKAEEKPAEPAKVEEKPAEVPKAEEKPVEAPAAGGQPGTTTPAEGGAAEVPKEEEKPAEEKPAEAGGGDVKVDAAAPAGEQPAEDHFGKPFKLPAIMLLDDVVKNAEYYSTLETVKLRGEVLAVKGGYVLLGSKTSEGQYAFCALLAEASPFAIEKGQTIVLEGKLLKRAWSLADFDNAKFDNLGADYDYLLSVDSGEKPGENE